MCSGVIKMNCQIYRFTWQSIEVKARYNPNQWNVIAHLEIEAINPERTPLPITETGYLSHFHEIGSIERDYDGDVMKAVAAWLDKEAKSKQWQEYIEKSRQGELF